MHCALIDVLESRRLLAAGDPDLGFSGNGAVISNIGTNELVEDAIVQSDGKVLVVGSVQINTQRDAFVARFTAAGALDGSFGGGDGVATLNIGANDSANGVLLRGDKIVIGGVGGASGFLAQFTAAGIPDSTWAGGDGIFHASGPVRAMTLLGNGKLITGHGSVVSRVNANGTLDGSFGNGGRRDVLAALSAAFPDPAQATFASIDIRDVDAQANGGIIVTATGDPTSSDDSSAIVTRLTSSGNLDLAFGGGGGNVSGGPGYVEFDNSNGFNRSMGTVIQPSGRIITAWNHDMDDIRLHALNAAGDGDTSFGNGGRVNTGFAPGLGGSRTAADMALDSANRVIVAGTGILPRDSVIDRDSRAFVARRFTANGQADMTFNLDGWTSLFPEGQQALAAAMAIAPGDKIVVAGGRRASDPQNSDTPTDLAVARFHGGSSPPAVVNGTLTLNLGDVADELTINASGNTVTVSLNTLLLNLGSFTFPGTPRVVINSGDGSDVITINGNVIAQINGGARHDQIRINGSGHATVNGGSGRDAIWGGGGNDSLSGDADDDTIDGGLGGDTIKGGAGNDTADYSSRTADLTIGLGTVSDDGQANEKDNVWNDIETVLGGSGNDNIKGHANNNLLVGNGGNDSLFGNYGDDTLSGDAGADLLDGQANTDTAINSGGDTLVSIENNSGGGGGGDNSASVQGETLVVRGSAGADDIDIVGETGGVRVTVNGVVNQFFSLGDFQLIEVHAMGGADDVRVEGFTFAGEYGDVRVTAGEANDNVLLKDIVFPRFGAFVSVTGDDGNDTIRFENLDFDEAHGVVAFEGGVGNDTIEVATGSMEGGGGAGDDVLKILPGGFLEDYNGGAGEDVIDETAIASSYLVLDDYQSVEHARIRAGTVQGTGLANRLEVTGLGGGRLDGHGGNDTLIGGPGSDVLNGLDGDDSMLGNGGADTFLSEAIDGADTMRGGDGNDTVDYSQRGANLTVGIGTLADDGEAGEKDNVYLDIETIIGGSGNDSITGGAGNNLIIGGVGNDTLRGNYGNDTLSGNSGLDVLNGEDGTDTATNAAGDTLISIENA